MALDGQAEHRIRFLHSRGPRDVAAGVVSIPVFGTICVTVCDCATCGRDRSIRRTSSELDEEKKLAEPILLSDEPTPNHQTDGLEMRACAEVIVALRTSRLPGYVSRPSS